MVVLARMTVGNFEHTGIISVEKEIISFICYAFRWQLSTPILYLITKRISGIRGTIIANLIGAVIFYFVDRLIFK